MLWNGGHQSWDWRDYVEYGFGQIELEVPGWRGKNDVSKLGTWVWSSEERWEMEKGIGVSLACALGVIVKANVVYLPLLVTVTFPIWADVQQSFYSSQPVKGWIDYSPSEKRQNILLCYYTNNDWDAVRFFFLFHLLFFRNVSIKRGTFYSQLRDDHLPLTFHRQTDCNKIWEPKLHS